MSRDFLARDLSIDKMEVLTPEDGLNTPAGGDTTATR